MNAPAINLPQRKKAKLTVEDYLVLDDRGAFERYGKTELIAGEIYYMNSQHRPHARMKSRLFVELAKALAAFPGLEAIVEGSISIPPYNVPEPDIVVTDQPDGEGLIPLASVKLVIEVADTTIRNDLTRKAKLYAAAGVPEYWVIDLNAGTLHQMWSAGAKGFAQRRETTLGGRIESVTLAGLAVETGGL